MPINVLQLISSNGFFGAENVLLGLSTELTRLGHSVTIGYLKNPDRHNCEFIERIKCSSIRIKEFECRGKIDFKTLSSISSYVRDNSFDVIHSHGYKSNIYAVFSNIFNRKPLVATCHNWIISGSRMSLYTMLDRFFLKRFEAVVSVSAGVYDILQRSGIQNNRLFLIENGIDAVKFGNVSDSSGLRDSFTPGSTCPVVGIVGRLTEEKGHTFFLKAAKKILQSTDCFFLIVGDGALRSRLEDEAVSLGIENRVIFTGNRPDIPALLTVMDVFVMSSLTEGQPMALLEAMASGKAIVAAAVGDIPKILKNGKLGVLVPPADSEALADGILRYLRDPAEAQGCIEATRQEVIEKYSSSRMALEYVSVYNKLAG